MYRQHKSLKQGALILAGMMFVPASYAAGDREGWKHYKDEGSRYEVFGDFAGAERAYTKSLNLAKPPQASTAERGEVIARLANALLWQQKFDAAEPYFNELLKIIPSLKTEGKRNEDFFSCVDALSSAYFERITGVKKISAIQHSIRLIDTAFGEEHPDLLKELDSLSGCYSALGMNQEALTFANRALALSRKDTSEKGKIQYWKTLVQVGNCRKAVGDWTGAQKAFENAIYLLQKSPKRYSLTAASAGAQLAIIEFRNHRKEQAKRLFREAEAMYLAKLYDLESKQNRHLGSSGPELLAFAQMYVAFNEHEKAERVCRKSILWTQTAFGAKDPSLINEYRLHSFVLSRLGRNKESQKQEALARQLLKEYKGESEM